MVNSEKKGCCVNCISWDIEKLDKGRCPCRRCLPVVGEDGCAHWPLSSCHDGCDEHKPVCIGIHPTIEELPLSADCVRIVPGMLVHHPTEGSFMANAWVRAEASHRWLIQSCTDRLRSAPVFVGDCYASTDTMLEATRGSS